MNEELYRTIGQLEESARLQGAMLGTLQVDVSAMKSDLAAIKTQLTMLANGGGKKKLYIHGAGAGGIVAGIVVIIEWLAGLIGK